jgi:hypothetical protein
MGDVKGIVKVRGKNMGKLYLAPPIKIDDEQDDEAVALDDDGAPYMEL